MDTLGDMQGLKVGEAAQLPDGRIAFKFLTTERIKAIDTEEGKAKIVRLTASTNVRDSYGDTFTEKGLQLMKTAAPGTTIFLNHSQRVPEDVFGAVVSADLVKRKAQGTDGEEIEVLCLDYDVEVDDSNPRAAITYAQIQRGIAKLGASVTVAVRKKDIPQGGGGMKIDNPHYIECSIVGLPANPLSWVQYAQKALQSLTAASASTAAASSEAAPGTGEQQLLTKSNESADALDQTEALSITELIERVNADARAKALAETQAPVTADDLTVEKIKGLFATAMANQKPRPYELFDVLSTCMWRLGRLKDANISAGVTDDFDYALAATTAIDEFAVALKESFLHHLGVNQVSPAEISAYSLLALEAVETAVGQIKQKSMPDEEARGRVQGLHDLAHGMGAECVSRGAGDAAEVVTLRRQLSEATAEQTRLTTELELSKADGAQWKAGSTTMLLLLEKHGLTPMTGTAARSASASPASAQ
jgi:hypothetical protein